MMAVVDSSVLVSTQVFKDLVFLSSWEMTISVIQLLVNTIFQARYSATINLISVIPSGMEKGVVQLIPVVTFLTTRSNLHGFTNTSLKALLTTLR